MKRTMIACALLLIIGLSACGEPSVYVPEGMCTGNEILDEAVLSALQAVCRTEYSKAENLEAAYNWVMNTLTYRTTTEESPDEFTDEAIVKLAELGVSKKKTDCDGEAAVMAVLLRRMGYEAQVVSGTFIRDPSQDPVDHAWVLAKVNGKTVHFDPLYGRYFAEEHAADYCMADDSVMVTTHTWDASLIRWEKEN